MRLETDAGLFTGRGYVVGLLLLLVLTVACHWPVLSNGFIWDDQVFLFHSSLGQWGPSDRTTGIERQYPRLLAFQLLRIISRHSGVEPLPFHVLNLCLHAANTLLGFTIFWQTGFPPIAAFAAALFFGFHPATLETSAWIAGIFDALATFFLLTSLFLWLGSPSPWRRWLGALSFAACLFSKEAYAPFLLLAWPLDAERHPDGTRARALLVLLGGLALAFFYHDTLGRFAGRISLPGFSLMEGTAFYLSRLFLLDRTYQLFPDLDSPTLVRLASWLIFGYLLLVPFTRREEAPLARSARFLRLWLLIGLGNALLPFFLPTGIQRVADRYVYPLILPAGGLLFAALLQIGRRFAPGLTRVAWALVGALFLVECSVVFAHHAVFANDRLYWAHAWQVHPHNDYVLTNHFSAADAEERRALFPLLPPLVRQREEIGLLLDQGRVPESWSLLVARAECFTPLELAQRKVSLLAKALKSQTDLVPGTPNADLLIAECAAASARWQEPVFLYGLALGYSHQANIPKARELCQQVISRFGARTKYGLQATQLLEAMSPPAETVPDPK